MSGRYVVSKFMRLQHVVRHNNTKTTTTTAAIRCLSTAPKKATEGGLPDSIKRVGTVEAFPNEYPGQNYAFNWCLNGDGVTPLRKSAFRITKPLDLKVAGLTPAAKAPLKVKAAAAMPEAGSDTLSFEVFDEVSQRTRDLLSLADSLYCPEGHVPGTRTAVRVITNSSKLAPDMLAYLERAPRKEPPESLPITAYVLETADGEEFVGYAIEEIEVPVSSRNDDGPGWITGNEPEPEYEAKSVASVVVVSKKPDIKVIVAGLEASAKALAADALERQAKKEAEEKAKE